MFLSSKANCLILFQIFSFQISNTWVKFFFMSFLFFSFFVLVIIIFALSCSKILLSQAAMRIPLNSYLLYFYKLKRRVLPLYVALVFSFIIDIKTMPKIKSEIKDLKKSALARTLCAQQTRIYYLSLLEQFKQFINEFIEDLRKESDGMFTDDLILTLQQLDQPQKSYKSEVFQSAKIKMEMVLEKTIKDVLQRRLQNLTQFYESVSQRNKELSLCYPIQDQKKLRTCFSIKNLICFDIFSCAFQQNKMFKQNSSQQICIWAWTSLQKLYPTTIYQITKIFQFYEQVEPYISHQKIWRNLVGVGTLIKIKARFELIKKKKYQQRMDYLLKRQKRLQILEKKKQKEQKQPQYIYKTYNFCEIIIFSLTKLKKNFPIMNKGSIMSSIKQMLIELEQTASKSKILELQMKYQVSFDTINALFDSFARGLDNPDKYFHLRKSLNILTDVLMYAFCFYDSFKDVVKALNLETFYSIQINKKKGNLIGDQEAIACIPIAEVMQMKVYLRVTFLHLEIQRRIGRPFMVFKKLEFCFSKVCKSKRLKKKYQIRNDPKVTLVLGTYKGKLVHYQITRGKLNNQKYVHSIENYIKKCEVKEVFALVIADFEATSSISWQNLRKLCYLVKENYHSRTYFTSPTGICKLSIIMYLHLQKCLSIFRHVMSEENFEQIAEALISKQLQQAIFYL